MSIFSSDKGGYGRLVWSIAVFGIAAVMAGAPFMLLVWRPNFQGFDETGLRQAMLLEERAGTIHTVVLGDSMLSMAVNPTRPGMFNFSSPGDSIADMREKADFVLARVPGLSRVVVELDLHMFSSDRLKQEPQRRFSFLAENGGPAPSVACYVDRCCDDAALKGQFACTLNKARRILIDSRRPAGTPSIQDNGYTLFSQQLSWDVTAPARKEPVDSYASTLDTNYVGQYRALIDRLRARDISVIIATPPRYGPHMDDIVEWIGQTPSQVYEKFGLLDKADAFCDGADALGDDRRLYFNSTHANKDGARRYTDFLIQCLEGASPSRPPGNF